jgi:hypothetical protein
MTTLNQGKWQQEMDSSDYLSYRKALKIYWQNIRGLRNRTHELLYPT